MKQKLQPKTGSSGQPPAETKTTCATSTPVSTTRPMAKASPGKGEKVYGADDGDGNPGLTTRTTIRGGSRSRRDQKRNQTKKLRNADAIAFTTNGERSGTAQQVSSTYNGRESSSDDDVDDDNISQYPGAYQVNGIGFYDHMDDNIDNDTIVVSMGGGGDVENCGDGKEQHDYVIDDASIARSTDGELAISLTALSQLRDRWNEKTKVRCFYFWLVLLLVVDIFYYKWLAPDTFGHLLVSILFAGILGLILLVAICGTILTKSLPTTETQTQRQQQQQQ